MVEIAIAESAYQDLDSSAYYIAQDSTIYAQEFGVNFSTPRFQCHNP